MFTLYQCGSSVLIRKRGDAQIFVGRKDISTEVLYMLDAINKYIKQQPTNLLPASKEEVLDS